MSRLKRNKKIQKGDHALYRTFKDNEVIIRENDDDREMYVIQSGGATVWKQVENGEVHLCSLERGDFFGEMSMMESLPRSATVRASGETKVLILKPGGFLLKLRRDPTFAYEIIQQLCSRLRRVNEQVAALVNGDDLDVERLESVAIEKLRDRLDKLRQITDNLTDENQVEGAQGDGP